MSEDSLFSPVLTVYGRDGAEYRLSDPICDKVGVHGCTKCRKLKLLTAFPGDGKKPGWWCYDCCNSRSKSWAADNLEAVRGQRRRNMKKRREEQPEAVRRAKLKDLYGPGAAEWYDETSTAQGGVCAICGNAPKSGEFLHIDHDHDHCNRRTPSGRAKGCAECRRCLLCRGCNRGMGLLNDDPRLLLQAAAMLLAWKLRLHRQKAAEVAEHLRAIRMLLEEGDV